MRRVPILLKIASLCCCILLTACASDNRGGAFYQKQPFRYQVVNNDTLGSISQRYDVTQQDLARANNLQSPYILNRGQWLTIPGKATYTVQSGDTLYAIARRFNTSPAALQQINRLSSSNIYPGQKLKVVTADYKPRSTTASPQKPSAPATKKAPPPAIKPQKLFYKPVQGNIAMRYGKQGSGQKSEGLKINAPSGSSVKAAQDGTVAYAGNEIRGFGNLVLIKHQVAGAQWISTYAHLNNISVKKGQTVKGNAPIGTVGMTGNVKSPQLYFELRRGKTAVNPELYLK